MGIFDLFSDDEPESIPGDTDSPEFAYYILNKIKTHRTPLLINFRGVEQQYVSMILDVDKKQNIVVLDEFSPEDGHKRALKGDSFRASSSDNGVAVVFRTKINGNGTERGIAYYTIELPEHVEYVQRRDAFRLQLTSGMKYPVRIVVDDRNITDCIIHDISFSGICITIRGVNLENVLHRGEILENMRIEINEEETLLADAIIKRVVFNEASGTTTAAFMFYKLELNQQRQLNKFVTDLERIIIRRQKNLED